MHVPFALERGVLSRFARGVVKRCPTTLVVFLRVNDAIKMCALAGPKEFVNVHRLSTKQPEGVDTGQRWMWVDPIKKAIWWNRTTTDAVV